MVGGEGEGEDEGEGEGKADVVMVVVVVVVVVVVSVGVVHAPGNGKSRLGVDSGCGGLSWQCSTVQYSAVPSTLSYCGRSDSRCKRATGSVAEWTGDWRRLATGDWRLQD